MERLQKIMAHAGVASRRKSEELIQTGRVKVNGKVIKELGTQVSRQDRISVDDVIIEREQPVYYLLNKPRGVVSSVSDDKGRKTVLDLFPNVEQRIYPVGRLDYDTTGALILTNDGEFAQLLMHPKYEIEKTYVAKVKGRVEKPKLAKLEKGIMIEGKKSAPAKARLLSWDKQKETSMIELIIHEGQNHQVKKMLQAIGYPVEKLKREKYGHVSLQGLQPAEWRELKKFEVQKLIRAAKNNE